MQDYAHDVARIRELNDALRSCREPIGALIQNGSVMLTQALAMRGEPFVNRVLATVAAFDEFDSDNDPWQEHDMAFLDVDGERVFFKVDYYDAALECLSPDPADPGVTRRVLTIGLASDY